MNLYPKIHSAIAAVVVLSLAGSGSALAGKKNNHHDSGYGHSGHHDKHYGYNKHHRNKYKRHQYQNNHYKHYNRGYGARYYKSDDDDSDEALVVGLLLGGLLGYAILNASSDDSYEDSRPSSTRPWKEPQPALHESHQGSTSSCLQTREYQSKVIVGGEEVDAYGDACLQPDGSWMRGPAKLALF